MRKRNMVTKQADILNVLKENQTHLLRNGVVQYKFITISCFSCTIRTDFRIMNLRP